MKKTLMVVAGVLSLAVQAAVLCSGSSSGVKIDTTSGTRTAAAMETIRYSTAWETTTSGATAVVAVDGATLKSATGAGSVGWTPTRNGTYTLTHKVMNGSTQVGETLKATFVVEGINPANPVITPESGTIFDSSLTITMSCASEGATIRYTTDGSEPTQSSSLYKRFRISGKTTVKARAFYENGVGSEVVTAEYALGRCPDPVIVSAGGTTFANKDNVVRIDWECPDGALRYTTDGADVTPESPVYAGSFTISDSTTVKAKAFSARYFDSAEVTANLVREWETVATPVITAAASFTGSETKVEIACATPGATVRYTLNGNEPNSHSTKYTGPFWVKGSCTVKVYATCADYLNSDVASLVIAKVWGIGDTMGAPDHAFATSGDLPFVRVTDATATRGESMRSGAVGDEQRSVLSTTVVGPGTVSFRWKTSCEEDDELHDWDHAVFTVDGVEVARQDGVTDWLAVSLAVMGPGEHVVAWTYVKDDVEKDGEDCVWVADFVWTPDEAYTHESAVPVPYAWIRAHVPHTPDEYASYEAAVRETAANGRDTVEACYVAGLDPTDPDDVLRASVQAAGGEVRISWAPDQNTGAVTRIYTVWGRTALDDAAGWVSPATASHCFFKVSVAMPTGAGGEESAVSGSILELGGVQLWEGGPYWAECNVGASKPEEYGYYFWWGDTVGYTANTDNAAWTGGNYWSGVTWGSSKGATMGSSPFSPSTCSTYDKSDSTLQSQGYIDAMGNLVAKYDAATAHLGAPWRMPTDAEFSDLVRNCTATWTMRNGVYGRLVTGKGAFSAKSIFLPAAGYGYGACLSYPGSYGVYWSSTLSLSNYNFVRSLYFDSGNLRRNYNNLDLGLSVRPLRGFAN